MKTKLTKEQIKSLVADAIDARSFSYSPYSNFKVGAALLTKSGKVFKGCNIENAAYTPTVCAERTAVFKAVSEGEKDFEAIAIIGGYDGVELSTSEPSGPCGVCRQVLLEFSEDLTIISANSLDHYYITSLDALVPMPFGPKNLSEK